MYASVFVRPSSPPCFRAAMEIYRKMDIKSKKKKELKVEELVTKQVEYQKQELYHQNL